MEPFIPFSLFNCHVLLVVVPICGHGCLLCCFDWHVFLVIKWSKRLWPWPHSFLVIPCDLAFFSYYFVVMIGSYNFMIMFSPHNSWMCFYLLILHGHVKFFQIRHMTFSFFFFCLYTTYSHVVVLAMLWLCFSLLTWVYSFYRSKCVVIFCNLWW